jgi:hypothetical protein
MSKSRRTVYVPPRSAEPRPEHGPAMRALHPRWRSAVEMLFHACGNQAEALRLAGYRGKPKSMKVMASRIFADDRVRKAIREEVDRRMDVLQPEMLGVTLGIVRDIANRPTDRLRGAAMIWDRINPIQSRHLIEVEHHLTSDERDLQHYRALKRLGAPPDAFLARFGPNGLPRVEALALGEEAKRHALNGGDTIEADYEEVIEEP